jgi:hypothetical protein
MLCLRMHSNVMLRFMVQAFKDTLFCTAGTPNLAHGCCNITKSNVWALKRYIVENIMTPSSQIL